MKLPQCRKLRQLHKVAHHWQQQQLRSSTLNTTGGDGPAQVHHPQVVRMLYRALLRELSYFPDTVATTQLRGQITTRFRCVKKGGWIAVTKPLRRPANKCATSELPFASTTDNSTQAYTGSRAGRYTRRLETGLKFLKTLKKANKGSRVATVKVLKHAYGRVGKRKHQLMSGLLPNQTGFKKRTWLLQAVNLKLGDKSLNLHDQYSSLEDRDTEQSSQPPYKVLKALVGSQLTEARNGRRVPGIKATMHSPPIGDCTDVRNIKRRVNKTFCMVSNTLQQKLLAPLPESEWKHLQAIAARTKLLPTRPLRAPGLPTPCCHSLTPTTAAAEQATELTTSGVADTMSQTMCNISKELIELSKESRAQSPQQMVRPLPRHRPGETLRQRSRIWASVFELCPLLTHNDSQNSWNVTWGDPVGKSVPVVQASSLFHGLTRSGKILPSAPSS